MNGSDGPGRAAAYFWYPAAQAAQRQLLVGRLAIHSLLRQRQEPPAGWITVLVMSALPLVVGQVVLGVRRAGWGPGVGARAYVW